MGLHYILAQAGFALSIWGFVEIGCLRQTNMAPIRFQCVPPEADYSAARAVAQLKS